MGNAFNLGTLFGIQFKLHYTWFIIFVLITTSLSWQVFPANYSDWPVALYWITGIIASLLFFASVVAHELAHSLVGRANGIPVKSITLFIFGGVALMTKEATRPGAEFRMAVAGPACSLVIGGLFVLLHLFTRSTIEPIAAMAYWLAYINVALAIFNLVPGFPLDGGRVFRSLWWRVTGNYRLSTQIATRVGQGVGYLFILGGILIVFLQPFGLSWFSGLWLAFVGWFLENAASASYRQLQQREALQKFPASQVMTTGCSVVPPNITISQLLQKYILTSGHQCFLVADEGRLEGILMLPDIKSVPQQNWDLTQVREIMNPINKIKTVHADHDALSILEEMDENKTNQLLVASEGRVIGLITRDNLIKLLSIRSRLGA